MQAPSRPIDQIQVGAFSQQYIALVLIVLSIVASSFILRAGKPVPGGDVSKVFETRPTSLTVIQYNELFDSGSEIPNSAIVDSLAFLLSNHDVDTSIEITVPSQGEVLGYRQQIALSKALNRRGISLNNAVIWLSTDPKLEESQLLARYISAEEKQ